MIKEEDVILSKMSYTDKDFASIYPDLLDLAKQLTDKWDPSLSDESDPGVVLLKEGAFISDHNNYNIDKNILENFLPSATQDLSVRNILDLNGYTPEYYISATGDVTFTYKPSEKPEDFVGFVLPEFSLVVTTSDSSIAYTQVGTLTISDVNTAYPVRFMEGTIQSLSVNGNETILLENLDDNNRVYFPHKHVAENGIFIKNVATTTQASSEYWEPTSYISTQPLNSKVYRVGYDSSLGVPFIEFPSDIANIIGSGLSIKYMSTTGAQGNVKANSLIKLDSTGEVKITDTFTLNTEDFNITNASSITNGKDPETINEMYRSFKKVIGTFDTLVTCKDYTNALYTANDGTNKLVSNGVVTDINSDYNNAFKIITYDQWGEYFETASKKLNNFTGFNLLPCKPKQGKVGNIIYEDNMFKVYNPEKDAWVGPVVYLSYNDFVDTIEAMSPYDLCLYALKNYSFSDYSSVTPARAIENSFTPIGDKKFNELIDEKTGAFAGDKCIVHNFSTAREGDVVCFKNYVPLNITITPYTKVTKTEKEAIIDSIYQALSNNFNASKVDFGEELNYDAVLEVILNCNDNIKNIRLEDFKYNPKAVIKTGSDTFKEVELYNSLDTDGCKVLLDVIAKNVLAGRLCLFNFDDEFEYKYGQVNQETYKNIASIKTEVVVKPDTGGTDEGKSSVKEQQLKVNHIVNGLKTAICMAGKTADAQGTAIIPVNSATQKEDWVVYELQDDQVFWLEKKGYKYKYSNDAEGKSIIIVNNTTKSYRLPYNGVDDNNYQTLEDNNILIITRTATQSEVNYGVSYSPKENEYIEIAYNNYVTDAIFPTYIKYRFVAENSIAKNADYELQSGESIRFTYTENDVVKNKEYLAGDVIRPNFELLPTDSDKVKGITVQNDGEAAYKYATINSGQQIEHRVLMKTVLDTSNTLCYWVMNNNSNTLFYDETPSQKRTEQVILGSNEYFILSNADKDSMVMYGPGTLLTRSDKDDNTWSITKKATIADINANGFSANIDWKVQDFTAGRDFSIQEMNIVTIANGDSVSIADWEAESEESEISISNEWTDCDGKITYSIGGEETTLPKLPAGETYKVRSRLDIALNNTTGQKLQEGQKFVITYEDAPDVPVVIEGSDIDPVYLQSSVELNLYGDNQINIADYTSGSSSLDFNKYEFEPSWLYLKNYKAEYTGDFNKDTIYYSIENYKYVKVDQTIKDYCWEQGCRYMTDVYNIVTTSKPWYTLVVDDEGEPIYTKQKLNESNGKYAFSITGPGYAEFKLGYKCKFNESLTDEHKEYILPIFLNYGGIEVEATLEDLESGLTVQLQDYNFDTPVDKFILNNTAMYLLRVCIKDPGDKDINTNLKLKLYWDGLPPEAEILQALNPVIANGANEGFGPDIKLGDVLTQINELIKNSTKSHVKPYYIYKPEDSIAIQYPDMTDPNVFWDKNNIINGLIIPQIDIATMADKDYPTVDIIKTMRNYK